MIYKLTDYTSNDINLEEIRAAAMKRLDEFYKTTWSKNTPRIIIVPDRKTIDDLQGQKTEPWVVGWAEGRNVFVLDNDAMESESKHKKHSAEKYAALITHELSHAYYRAGGSGQKGASWLWEGVAIYSSGQTRFQIKPTAFSTFLDYY